VEKTFRVIGLMSGTSLDGLDIAYCEFTQNPDKWTFKSGPGVTISYDNSLKEQLQNARSYTGEDLSKLHVNFGKWMGTQVKNFIAENKLEVDFISSHGHTVFHQPEIGLTLQIGDLNHIASATQKTTIGDFRTLDVALGGQGAPLVPIGDELLFSQYDNCLNLGGIANVSFNKKGKRIAFDICPVNIVLNALAAHFGKAYDDGGKISSEGKIDTELLKLLNAVEFNQLSAPKSLGIEYIEKEYFPILKASVLSEQDQMRTFVEYIAQSIVANIKPGSLLVTGGGAKNSFLIERVKANFKNGEVVVPEVAVIDFKEAIIFAFLGVLRHLNLPNCLSSVTGAKHDCRGGVVVIP
jgi:anhydro-N-acetylmuramic acid kinase